MNKIWSIPLQRSRYLLAVVAGLLWTAAFPKPSVAGFAWVAPGLMVATALATRQAEAFRLGYVAGLAHYLSMLYWLLLIPYRWHGIPWGPALGWLALGAFLSLFPAAWVWIITPGPATLGSDPSAPHSAAGTSVGLGRVLPRNWFLRLGWALGGAAAWVGLEMFLARIFGGFAWDLLGVSQFRLTPLIQLSSITGVYGISFLAVWVSLALVSAGVMVIQRPTARSVWIGEVFLPVITVAILFNLGFREIRQLEPPQRTINMTLVQPSIPQTLIWDPTKDSQRFNELLSLSEQALSNATDVLVWPEASVPKMLRYDQETFHAITNLAGQHHVWMIIGSDDAEPHPGAKDHEEPDFYNGSFLISPEGKLIERYTKRNLVMFGEYVPFSRFLPFLKYLTPIEGGFTPGSKTVPFDLRNLNTKTQVLICYEDIFPHLAREALQPDVDFLVNITNDGWFGEGAAQWQQGATGLFRAVENRLPLIRCANNGLTCWVDPRGVLRDVLLDSDGTIYGKGFLTFQLPLPAPGTLHMLTFYTRHGDLFGWCCVGIGILMVATRVVRNRSTTIVGVDVGRP